MLRVYPTMNYFIEGAISRVLKNPRDMLDQLQRISIFAHSMKISFTDKRSMSTVECPSSSDFNATALWMDIRGNYEILNGCIYRCNASYDGETFTNISIQDAKSQRRFCVYQYDQHQHMITQLPCLRKG